MHNAYKSGSGDCPPPFALITSYEIERERKKKKKKVSNSDNKIRLRIKQITDVVDALPVPLIQRYGRTLQLENYFNTQQQGLLERYLVDNI